jgi:trimeric autotransporter adhesin
MIKQRHSGPEKIVLLVTALLVASCGASEDPSDPEGPIPAELAVLQPDLEKAMHDLERLDHTGLPRTIDGEPPVSVSMQTGPLADRTFVAIADGGEEVPAVRTRASALMAAILDPVRREVLFALSHDVSGATAAHIHRAPGGQNGPVVVAVDHTRPFRMGFFRLSAADVRNLQAGRLYMNIHSRANTEGEVRGQLLRPGETLYTALLSGAEEVPEVKTSGRGGLGVILNRDKDQLRAEGSFEQLLTASTVAHIHEGIRGINGSVRFGLTLTSGRIAGSLSGTLAVDARDLGLLDREGFYVNVHSTRFELGEIRGQLTRK